MFSRMLLGGEGGGKRRRGRQQAQQQQECEETREAEAADESEQTSDMIIEHVLVPHVDTDTADTTCVVRPSPENMVLR